MYTYRLMFLCLIMVNVVAFSPKADRSLERTNNAALVKMHEAEAGRNLEKAVKKLLEENPTYEEVLEASLYVDETDYALLPYACALAALDEREK